VILLLLHSAQALQCKEELERRTKEPVMLCSTVRDAIAVLRRDNYSAVAVDENLLDPCSLHADEVARHAGTAAIVYFNPGISGVERVCKEIELALDRAQRERQMAHQAARHELKEQLAGTVTAILLSSELALQAGPLPPKVEEKLKSVRELAMQMSNSLR
jgi:hypothetical protein